MCGLVAVLGEGEIDRVRSALDKIYHRGIRHRIVEVRGGVIGHVRLPIVGLDDANDQPVRRGPWTIAFVGEVLDFREVRPGLDCDVDLVADSWADNGPAALVRNDGFWHVVAHDERDGSLHVLTDYLAQKPAYVRVDARAVASEPDALVTMGPTTPDEIYLSSVVKWGYCPETWRTPYREIRKTLPGEYTVIRQDGFIEWAVVDELEPAPASPDELKVLIDAAVRRRVQSADVPVAALVSGGLDSSIAYTVAKRYRDLDPVMHYPNGEGDQFSAITEGDPHAYVLGKRNVLLDEALDFMQEPVDLGSLVPQVALSDAIGDRADVCLTGDGADELFGGYGRAGRYDSQMSDVYHELVAWHLPRLDRVMMRNRIEVRTPFLARSVAGAALALPRAARTGKSILRDLYRRDLPRAVLDAPKRPLRTEIVERNRETMSRALVDRFRERTWG